jgi:plastocyanin
MMNTRIPKIWYLIVGTAIVFAVLLAGCTGTNYGPAPVTTQATPAATSPPATPVATTLVTTVPATPAATTARSTTVPATAASTTPLPSTSDVGIQNFAFVPASVTVPAGTTVTWTNQDSAPHQIISDATSLFSTGAIFMSGQLTQGQKFSFTFNTAGTYAYHCGIHPFMKGTITVT